MSKKHRKYMSNHKLCVAISFILAFLMSLSLLGVTVLGVVKNGLLSQQTIIDMMKGGYYEAIREKAEEAFSDYTIPTGIDPSVVEDTVAIDDVSTDINGYIYASFSGRDYEPNYTKMNERIKANVVKFFEDNSAEITDDKDEIIDRYIQELDSIYLSNIEMKFIKPVVSANNLFSRFYLPVLLALSVLSLALGLTCVRLHHYAHRGLRYVVYGVFATALMSLIAPLALIISGFYKRLLLDPEYFYNLVVSYVHGFLMRFVYASLIWFGVGAVLILMIVNMKQNKIKER